MIFKTCNLLGIALPVVVTLSSCSLGIKSSITKSYPSLNPKDNVKVIGLKEPAPPNAEILGTVRIYDAGTLNCSYDVVVEAAKTEVRKAGGNAMKITEHLTPSIWSSCHQIKANILRLDTSSAVTDIAEQKITQPGDTSQRNQVTDKKKYKAFYLTAEAGWSWRTAKLASDLNSFQREYLSELKSGYHYGFGATYYFSRGFGMGLMYDNHIASNSVMAEGVDTSTGQTVTGRLWDDISIEMIAASFDFRIFSKSEKNSMHYKISIGYCGYKDEGGFLDYGNIKGSTIGLSYDISYDIFLSKNWYLSPAVAYRAATLSSYDLTINNTTRHVDLDKENYFGLSRFDLSAQIRYRF